MDKTKGTNTLYTADDTRVHNHSMHPPGVPPPLSRQYLSPPQSHYYPPPQPVMSQIVHAPMQPQTIYTQDPINRMAPSRGNSRIQYGQRNRQRQILTYCPVCRRDYSNYEVQEHSRIHDRANSYHFYADSNDKDLNKTAHESQVSTGEMYPMVEPLEFWTNQLSTAVREDNFIFREDKNYDEVDRNYFKHLEERGVQTLNRPPLQYESERTNWYNCFDNLANSGRGPKFSPQDITSHNQWITSKRHQEEWQLMRQPDYKSKH